LLLGGILLAILSLFVVTYVVFDYNFLGHATVATGIVIIGLLWLGSWFSLSRASDEFDSTLELDV
jgi:hypothetical protein